MTNMTPNDFRIAMRNVIGACSLITTGVGEDATGLIVSTAVSLTTEPPQLLACINRSSANHAALRATGYFACSSLGALHQPIAERFSGLSGIKGAARFDGTAWETAVTGARLLVGAPAAFDCVIEEMIARATHSIVIGRVVAIRTTPAAGALVYRNGAYQTLDV